MPTLKTGTFYLAGNRNFLFGFDTRFGSCPAKGWRKAVRLLRQPAWHEFGLTSASEQLAKRQHAGEHACAVGVPGAERADGGSLDGPPLELRCVRRQGK